MTSPPSRPHLPRWSAGFLVVAAVGVVTLATWWRGGSAPPDPARPAAAATEPDLDLRPPSAAIVRVAVPRPGYRVVSDLTVHGERLIAAVNADPLKEDGAAVLASDDGSHWVPLIDRDDSQGFLRVRSLDGVLYAPEADPPGRGTGRIWRGRDAEGPTSLPIPDVAHAYDIARLGSLVLSGGGGDHRGFLRTSVDGEDWPVAETVDVLRTQFLARFRERLFISKTLSRTGPGEIDFLTWVPGDRPRAVDAVPGEAHTWRWYVAGNGRLYWSYWERERSGQVRCSEDGENWQPIPSLSGQLVWDFAELDGRLHAVSPRGVWASEDGYTFRLIADAPNRKAFAPVPARPGNGINVEATGSLEAWRGTLWIGGTRNGVVYRLETGSSARGQSPTT